MTDLISDKHCSHECVCPYYGAYTIGKEPCVLPCVDRLNLLSDELATERERLLNELRDWSYTLAVNNSAIAAMMMRVKIDSLRGDP